VTARAIGTAVLLLALGLAAGCGTQPSAPRVGEAPAAEDLAGLGAAPARPTAKATPAPRTPSAKPSPTRTRSASPKPPANAASRLRTLPGGARQVVVVSADGYGTSHATLETFAKKDGVWRPALGAMPARLGTNGFTDSKAEGDLETPTGMYGFGPTMYGIAANPGVRYAYHRLVTDDWWNENPATPGYNTFQHGPDPGGVSEALWTTAPQYDHFAVITYNIPVVAADPPRGSGIFLHVMVPGRATAGCVSLAEPDLLRVLRWLDPAARPRVVLAPASELDRY
jgi:L,D-peptidoglycan transpeptidase YkuD (ErfK/YbiS/YcfS/YnhG family)